MIVFTKRFRCAIEFFYEIKLCIIWSAFRCVFYTSCHHNHWTIHRKHSLHLTLKYERFRVTYFYNITQIHWASKETYHFFRLCHSLKSKASTWIIFGHRLGKFILNKHIKKIKFTSIKEEINAMKWQEVNFQKSQKLLASRAGSRYGVYVTRHWNWMNSYWMFWVGCLRGARSVSSFRDFRKMTFRDLTAYFSFLTRKNIVFFRYFCVQISLILIAWILVSVALKKW